MSNFLALSRSSNPLLPSSSSTNQNTRCPQGRVVIGGESWAECCPLYFQNFPFPFFVSVYFYLHYIFNSPFLPFYILCLPCIWFLFHLSLLFFLVLYFHCVPFSPSVYYSWSLLRALSLCSFFVFILISFFFSIFHSVLFQYSYLSLLFWFSQFCRFYPWSLLYFHPPFACCPKLRNCTNYCYFYIPSVLCYFTLQPILSFCCRFRYYSYL